MRVAGQILENLFWPAEGALGVNHPFHVTGPLTQRLKGRQLGQRFQFTVELELALPERLSQMNQEPLAEEATEDLDGKEKRFAIFSTGDPPRDVGADAAARHYAMDMRMEMEILTPSVKHGQETDGRAQVPGVCRDGEHRLGHCPEENAVDYPGILQRQAGDLLRQCKHHVEILHRQQLGLPFGQPLGAGRGLALRATPISTRVIRDGAMSALIALVRMAA